MAYKVFQAPTGSGNVVFEGDVINGYTTPDAKKVKVQFFSNDRGYVAAAFHTDREGAKALKRELETLVNDHALRAGTFSVDSANRNFKLAREIDGARLILTCNGNDAMQGRSFHRGDEAGLKKVVEEFDKVLATIEDALAGKITE